MEGGSSHSSAAERRFQNPVFAQTSSRRRPVESAAYDCVRIVVIRDGSALVRSQFGQRPITVGDALLLCANTLCAIEQVGWHSMSYAIRVFRTYIGVTPGAYRRAHNALT